MRRLCGIGLLWIAGAITAAGQGYTTPVRVSWTEDAGTAATITWDTLEEARGEVRYGLTTNYTEVERDGGGVRRHAITLRGLQPGTRYFYEASSSAGAAQAGTFRTAPAAGQPLHFAVHGDMQGGISVGWAQTVADRLTAEDPQWVIQVGDLSDEAYVAPGFSTWTNFFQICSNELARAVFMPILGNHDDPTSTAVPTHELGLFHRLFALPEPSLGKGTYAFTVGDIRFISLNTEISAAAQTNWLARELQAAANDTNSVWTIAVCHRPPYSWGERDGWDEGKDNWSPLLVQYEADWMISGHSHNYQRTIPIRGVRYLVAGGGGGTLYDPETGMAGYAFATSCYHHVSCRVTGEVMQVQAIRSDGLVFDSATVTNRRQVRVAPAFPLRGEAAKISYRATEGPLAGASPVHIHLGKDEFSAEWTNAAMTWNAGMARWEYEFTVPGTATSRLAFVFCDAAGTNWHDNFEHDWQALLGRASVTPAAPTAGSVVTLRYEADMGPLAGATQVLAWVACNGGRFPATNGLAMTNVSGARWERAIAVPAHAEELVVAFSSGSGWDDDYRRNRVFPVAGASANAWPPAPFVAAGSPPISDDPTNELPNHVGDNFDLAMASPPVVSRDELPGFGSWGQVWLNADATNLTVGGIGADLGGSNNVFLLFLGVDSLTDNAWNLWHKSGPPAALDQLHNVRFTEPMDVAFVLGDQYGDGPAYTNFIYGGTDFGQGVYYIGTNGAGFAPMTDARVSQFGGTGTVPCADGGTGEDRLTTRWEVALPWGALGAAGPEAVSNLFLCGVIGSSSATANDRYLSRTVLGERAWGRTDEFGQYAKNTAMLQPLRVNLLHADLRGDGLSNGWRQDSFGTPDGPPAREDTDGDGQTNGEEETGGTDPLDRNSFFALEADATPVSWSFVTGRFYDVDATTNLLEAFRPVATGLSTNRYEPKNDGFYRVRVRK